MNSVQRPERTSLERIVPDEVTVGEATGVETLRLHMERYQFAAENLLPGSVLDLACGVGYGTALLAGQAGVTQAVGVDINPPSVEYARQRYGSARILFECSDAMKFQGSALFMNIVSLETVEHVEDPRGLFAHLVSLLALGGRLIASVPITPSVDANPHHRTNFSAASFKRMGKQNSLQYVTSMVQVQKFNPVAVVRRTETRTADLRHNLALFYLRNPSHLGLRLWSTMRDGFVNKYLTVVWEHGDADGTGHSPM